MKTIIFDIDGTITNIWPLEKAVLLALTKGKYGEEMEKLKWSGLSETYKIFLKVSHKKIGKLTYTAQYNLAFSRLSKLKRLPSPQAYPLVKWMRANSNQYHFIYATGGQKLETEYVLRQLGLIKFFDLQHSLSKSNYPFSKKTGQPFKRLKRQFPNCLLITDSPTDCYGAKLAKIPYYQIK